MRLIRFCHAGNTAKHQKNMPHTRQAQCRADLSRCQHTTNIKASRVSLLMRHKQPDVVTPSRHARFFFSRLPSSSAMIAPRGQKTPFRHQRRKRGEVFLAEFAIPYGCRASAATQQWSDAIQRQKERCCGEEDARWLRAVVDTARGEHGAHAQERAALRRGGDAYGAARRRRRHAEESQRLRAERVLRFRMPARVHATQKCLFAVLLLRAARHARRQDHVDARCSTRWRACLPVPPP